MSRNRLLALLAAVVAVLIIAAFFVNRQGGFGIGEYGKGGYGVSQPDRAR